MQTVLLSLSDTARRLGCHVDTLKRAIRRGELPASKVFGRLKVREADLESLLARRFASGGDQENRGDDA